MARQPDFIPKPFAENGDRATIPETTDGAVASWELGFPVITSTPISSGGVAPRRTDFNAAFYSISAHTVYSQAGGIYSYSTELDYDNPALVYDPSDEGVYFCVQANGPNTGVIIAPHDDTNGEYWDTLPIGNITWLNDDIPTRGGDKALTFAGDRTEDFPRGKLLRINGDDTYTGRVYGDPVYADGVTTITVWFDVETTVPSTITQIERSRLSPIATARGVALVTDIEYSEDEVLTLILSNCYSSVTITSVSPASGTGGITDGSIDEDGNLILITG